MEFTTQLQTSLIIPPSQDRNGPYAQRFDWGWCLLMGLCAGLITGRFPKGSGADTKIRSWQMSCNATVELRSRSRPKPLLYRFASNGNLEGQGSVKHQRSRNGVAKPNLMRCRFGFVFHLTPRGVGRFVVRKEKPRRWAGVNQIDGRGSGLLSKLRQLQLRTMSQHVPS